MKNFLDLSKTIPIIILTMENTPENLTPEIEDLARNVLRGEEYDKGAMREELS